MMRLGKAPSLLFAGLILAAPGFAAEPSDAFRVLGGRVVDVPAFEVEWESFRLPVEAVTALERAGRGSVVHFDEFPVAPGAREAIFFETFDLYAPGAKIWEVDSGARREIPRSRAANVKGRSPDGRTRIGLSLRADGSLYGLVSGPRGRFRLTGADARGDLQIEAATPPPDLDYARCGSEDLPIPPQVYDVMDHAGTSFAVPEGAGVNQAIIAVDTDVELMSEKFADSSAAATSWLADLFVALNTMYERDLDLVLLQGDTTLRIGSDPFNNEDTPASSAQLQEFGSWWSANQGAVERVFAMLISGKSSSPNLASGIAWLDGYCETQSTGGGYSINQVFTAAFPADLDARLVGHELGHNAASPHTHCYNPPVDNCYNAQPGCFGGSVSCPGGAAGTVMSYCNFGPPNGANCGFNTLDFHPTVQGLIGSFIASHSPACITSLTSIFTDGFESGNTSLWSSTTP